MKNERDRTRKEILDKKRDIQERKQAELMVLEQNHQAASMMADNRSANFNKLRKIMGLEHIDLSEMVCFFLSCGSQ